MVCTYVGWVALFRCRMWTCWDCDLQGPKGGIWAGDWVGLGPFGTLSGLQHSWVHFGPFQGGQAGLGTCAVSQN